MVVMAKLCRLAGVDELHVDPVVGKTGGNAEETRMVLANLTQGTVFPKPGTPYFPQAWGEMEPVLPVVSGGLSPVLLPQIGNSSALKS